jgi:hypothetical protein
MGEWLEWHAHYDDPSSSLSRRLTAVREQIVPALDRARPGPIGLLAPGGTVIWTRGTREPDMTPRVRSWFAAAGVRETAFVANEPRPSWSVGAGVLDGPSRPLAADQRLFTFRGDAPA